jgi:hypothetical protein
MAKGKGKRRGRQGAKKGPKGGGGKKSGNVGQSMVPYSPGGPMKAMRAMERVCSLSDPFCQAAVGARPPSDGADSTIGFPVIWNFSPTNDANKRAAFAAIAAYPYTNATMGTQAAGTLVLGATLATADANAWGSFIRDLRVVSFGIQIRRLVNDFNVAGTLTVAITRDFTLGGSYTMTNPETFTAYHRVAMAQFRQPLNIIVKADRIGEFYTSQSTASGFGDGGGGVSNGLNFPAVLVFLEGGSAASAVDIEVTVVMHVEAHMTVTGPMASMATRPPPPNSILDRAAGIARAEAPTFLSGATEVVNKQMRAIAMGALKMAVGAAGTALATRIGGPKLGMIAASAMIPDVD